MEPEVVSLLVVASLGFCAAAGGAIAHWKNRSAWKGCIVGAILGPPGVLLVSRLSFGHRPMVDQTAWSSFHSMVEHQSDCEILQLAVMEGRTLVRHVPHRNTV